MAPLSEGESRRAVITGAGSGLGRALAVALAGQGWVIALADVERAGAEETLRQAIAAGGRGRVELLDVTRLDQWQTLLASLQADWPSIDLLVNNAGVACAGEMGAVPLANWRWLLEVNLFGAIYGCHVFVDWLKRNPRGATIVNVASVAAVTAAPSMGPYNVSKAGVLALSETLYAELRPHGVGVTVVCPGFFASGLIAAGRFAGDHERAMAEQFVDRSRITADHVARATLRAIARRRLYVILPVRARVIWRFKHLAPRVFLRLLSRAYGRRLP
jgi:NAD(P)-dependent dehydrogenase (short-subunit alcohol dehydrogenase family)